MKTFEVTRKPRYEGEDRLHADRDGWPDDFLILVDGEQIGGTYYGGATDVLGKWVSWGPCGYSFGHITREGSEHSQVREYATNPSYFDRINADDRREREAEIERREAGWEAEDRSRRLGDDEPGPVTWTLPACHALYAPMNEVKTAGAWLAANGIEDLSGWHAAQLEQRAGRMALVYEAVPGIVALAQAMGNRNTSVDMTETRVATITTEPPEITVPPRPALRPVFEDHYPGRFPLIDFGLNTVCTGCTQAAHAVAADQMVPWPCAIVAGAISDPRESAVA